jgi:hypothetical protein
VIGGVYLIWRESKHREINIDYAFKDIGEAGPPPEVVPHAEEDRVGAVS